MATPSESSNTRLAPLCPYGDSGAGGLRARKKVALAFQLPPPVSTPSHEDIEAAARKHDDDKTPEEYMLVHGNKLDDPARDNPLL